MASRRKAWQGDLDNGKFFNIPRIMEKWVNGWKRKINNKRRKCVRKFLKLLKLSWIFCIFRYEGDFI